MILSLNMKEEKFLDWNLFPELVTDREKNDISAMIATSCADVRPRRKKKWSAHTELLPRGKLLILRTLLEAGVFLVVLNFIVPFSE
jgi:hypothetical protein